jgi:hypothetical protein
VGIGLEKKEFIGLCMLIGTTLFGFIFVYPIFYFRLELLDTRISLKFGVASITKIQKKTVL